ncbi:NADH dehydrogenase I iron-sulfur protein 75kDa subunit [Cyanidioschyzon merolae strain 10D]|jgi:NADH dehydrogenase/NADH:ubiquinone oxidoreductase subunit G|uniref:NADH dehydrogenase I iron-sulfur protein 75kDa subunit n=1 Tax=Cyanidioschyzon merolae (strain NIES-3377 / 10D) TaxID=280699 RepID=M1VDN6_CYAM1|nr:NADH dehydrogenase I iron-sulfur protein 75kDa subunit [Cyanidioschyzon merolae strain 10D]BAM80927.1 NADH dehydrogenase I iron-sulfur protein 75kDa subunit [Cyanidioschyzon merolae strain 10D]|eukprot:XP_005536963.1 NADH dehydrogenase I iron-sulfur protein 75kDa subunit [Cyanidioschyzon merolae strain 10D]
MPALARTVLRTALSKVLHLHRERPLQHCRRFGALTSKPYAFRARPWELKSTESIDVFDGVGSNIRIDAVGTEVRRILPRLNEEVNEEWISDKTRFAYDGLKRQRLTVPMVRIHTGEANEQLVGVDWYKARAILVNKLVSAIREAATPATTQRSAFEAHAIIGPYADCESIAALRRIFYSMFPEGTAFVHVQGHANTGTPPTDFRYAYCANTTLAGLEHADVILLVATNPRVEAPLLNNRIRKAVLFGNARVGLIGCHADLTYNREHLWHLGTSPATLLRIAQGRHAFCSVLAKAQRPAIIVSQQAFQRHDGAAIFGCLATLVDHVPRLVPRDGSWNGLNVLHTAANTVGALDLGFDHTLKGNRWIDQSGAQQTSEQPWARAKLLYLLGADDIDGLEELPETCYVVYQGHHGDYGASIADLILPGAAYTEKNGTFVNTEGRVQRTARAFLPPGQAKVDAEILDELLVGLDHAAGFFDAAQEMEFLAPHLGVQYGLQEPDLIRTPNTGQVQLGGAKAERARSLPLSPMPFGPVIENFYMTDPITRASATMAKCVRVARYSNFEESSS